MKKLLILTGIVIFAVAGTVAFKTFSDAQKLGIFSKIQDSKPPLTVAEVEKLMGSPTHIEHSETTGITGDVYHYPSPTGADMKIVFVNGIVFHTEYITGAKS
jgi:hypothetical protein